MIGDDFEELACWSAVASGRARVELSQVQGPRGKALRADFDFGGGGGFVVARLACALELPEDCAFTFDVRGSAPPNKFEMKLCDATGHNVWWYHRDAFAWPESWQPLRIESDDIEFAWGPAGGGRPSTIAAIEFVIAAGPGGKGSVYIHDLRLEDTSFRGIATVAASSTAAGHEPGGILRTGADRAPRAAGDDSADAGPAAVAPGWRSSGSGPQWLLIDFGARREYGGLIIDWEAGRAARRFDLSICDDAVAWKIVRSVRDASGTRSYLYLPGSGSRYLRLDLHEAQGAGGFGIVAVDVRPRDFARSPSEFFHQIATRERNGAYPKYLRGEQTCWSPVGVLGGSSQGLLNEEGLLETDLGGFSLEPFVYVGGDLVTWADATVTQTLEDGFLPIPSSCWETGEMRLRTTAFAAGTPAQPVLYVRYRIEAAGSAPARAALFVALRPFQVVPPWQAHGVMGGPSPIRTLRYQGRVVLVNGDRQVFSLTPDGGFGAATFDQGTITGYLSRGELPPQSEVDDNFGYACGALRYEVDLTPGSVHDVFVAVPFHATGATGTTRATRADLPSNQREAAALFERTTCLWRDALGNVELRLPGDARALGETLKTAAAHILINRDGAALQPGPRRYARTWMRDGATMSAALLRTGHATEVRDFLEWFAHFQRPDGAVPAIVGRSAVDPLPEHDSHGQFLYTIAEYFRFTGDRDFLSRMWPAMLAAVGYIEALRGQRLGPEFETGPSRACYGLLPESVSHEGYLAQPVHAYWDDFWALRGLKDAATMAVVLEDHDNARALSALRDSFRDTLYASIRATMTERDVAYIPASVEWADSDPCAIATAITTVDEEERLPHLGLERTFAEYLEHFDDRRAGRAGQVQYTPYEMRLIGALVRRGERERALQLLRFFFDDRRPPPWNAWSEIVWSDPKAPAHIGDMPHAWIGAEFILALRTLFAFERERDAALVLAAGLDPHWLAGGFEVAADNLPTYHGTLCYTLRAEDAATLLLSLSGSLAVPPGGFVLRPPLPGPLLRAEVDGTPVPVDDLAGVTIHSCPALVRLHCQP
ncbi:MAG: discoidin domain-containing protein [Deltaproteobacteria bacterium]|nr:discoidin domain-containing protein [Deltaproteobacteria bacterium]